MVRAFGLIGTIVASFFIRGQGRRGPDEHPQPRLLGHDAFCRSSGSAIATVRDDEHGHRQTGANGIPTVGLVLRLAGLVGLATSVAFVYITQYYTAGCFRPVREIAEASKTGPATNIISGIAVGFETTFVTAITIGIALLASHWLGEQAGIVNDADGVNVGGIFGTAVATMGMLMTTAYILAMDTFGPITDNAGGIAEFSQAGGRRPRDHRPPRRRRQHHQGADQGLRHRLGGAGRVPAVHRLHRQGQPDPARQIDAGTRTAAAC